MNRAERLCTWELKRQQALGVCRPGAQLSHRGRKSMTRKKIVWAYRMGQYQSQNYNAQYNKFNKTRRLHYSVEGLAHTRLCSSQSDF